MYYQAELSASFSFDGKSITLNGKNTPFSIKCAIKMKNFRECVSGNNIFITFATKSFNMTPQKWIKDRAIHGYDNS